LRLFFKATFVLTIVAVLVLPHASFAQDFTESFDIWPLDLKINGTVIACSGPKIDETVKERFKRSSKGEDGKVVALWLDDESKTDATMSLLGDNSVQFDSDSNALGQIKEIKESIRDASGVLICSSDSLSSQSNKMLDQLRSSLKELVHREGAVCVVGPAISSLGSFRHDVMDEMSLLTEDLGLVPDGILYWAYMDDADRQKMYGALASKPHSVAIGIPKNTALVLRGRKCRTLGEQKVSFAISANERQPYRVQHLADVSGKRASPYDSVVDLTAWRRDAIERQLPVFPAARPPEPVVQKGTLFIVGGGGMPKGLMAEMVELAGGKQAHMVYVPCTEIETVSEKQRIVTQWEKMGVASAKVFHTKDRTKANSDKGFLETMENATGVWFGGGRQWNFADSYYGTEAHRLMKQVLAKGGVIGGSSAGASIQGGYLARANPVANFDIMAAGYERGLGFLPGVAIDQHFSQRGRQKDMTQLADRYPQLLGIGIDEGTAIRVTGSHADVIGKGRVFFYDRRKTVVAGEDDFTALSKGQAFDLIEREPIEARE
jgi:cyanophycinase